MKIANEKPPAYVWMGTHKLFEIDDAWTVYTYGDTIYNPAGIRIPDHMVEHESVHMEQQKAQGPATWWQRYLNEPAFRLQQEIEAYGQQYAFICFHNQDRNTQAKYLNEIIHHLTSDMYKVEITREQARRDILRLAMKYARS